ncbi:biotin/lipoate--protein ligase family protein [uncultured Roseobacter sp.]|uniref:biotin/lipoate--protein ligase family protein n=1 Tax=uncultured Roseobacter sp. TaxID=114847 RepID=UPI0026222DEA|nr:biotin/lipoate--protein ligase family protein [uncultured Roseobacter sp.]
MSGAQFPPLFSGLVTAGADPFPVACEEAIKGCDAGLVTYDIAPDRLRAAIVFAPEISLRDAMVMLPVCGVGFQNAFGALAPPEVSVHLDWDGGLRLNGARCGTLQAAAAPGDPDSAPDWLVIGLDLTLWSDQEETGTTPDVTSLNAEGCSEVDPMELLEAWVRHTLVWINRWDDEGVKPVHTEWTGLAHGIGKEITLQGKTGTFRGIDETFGLLLQQDAGSTIIPLTSTLREIS